MSEPTDRLIPDEAPPAQDARLAHIAVRTRFGDPAGTRILVNGTDVAPRCRAMVLELDGAAVPARLTLDLASDVDLDLTGVVQLLPTADGEGVATPGQAIAEWLDAVDTAELEQHLLTGGMGRSPVTGVLDALKALALRS